MCFLKLGEKINKRLGAMNKLTNIVHSGWMTKSPPEQKLQSPLKLFRARWKQRFFVLHKPSGSLPDQYELSYYNSEQCSKKKGSIDLDQCEQIIESLDSDQYPNLLAIKTICRGKVRTYYLATSTEEDMGNWVQCLCRVCGLKQEDTPTDIPDSRLSGTGNSTSTPPLASSNSVWSPQGSATPPVISQPLQASTNPSRAATIASSTSSSGSQPLPSTSPQSYVLLNECTSGTPEKRIKDRYNRADSVDSVPEYPAPPPPAKKGSRFHNNNNNDIEDDIHTKDSLFDSVFDVYDRPPPGGGMGGPQETYDRPPPSGGLAHPQETYDRPPPAGGLSLPQETYDRPPRSDPQELYDRPRSGELKPGSSQESLEDFYQVPPSCGGGLASKPRPLPPRSSPSEAVDLNAAVPLPMPRRSPSTAHSSLSERPESTDSMFRPMTENYDVPPPRIGSASTSSQEGRASPPTPPQRPPKPPGLVVQSPYQNLPSNSKAYEAGNSLSAVPAAPPKVCGLAAVTLSYDVPRSSTAVPMPRDQIELEVAPPAPAPRKCAPFTGPSYLNTVPGLTNAPSVPPLPDAYHPSRNGGDKGAENDGGVGYTDIDDVAPPPPPPPPASQAAPSCPPKPGSESSYADMSSRGGGQDLYQVPPVAPRPQHRSSTLPAQRVSGAGVGAAGVAADAETPCIWSSTRTKSFKRNNQVQLSPTPARPPPLGPRRPPLPARNEFASSSEDDDDLSVDGNNTHHDLSVVRMSTVPAAPDMDTEPELKYLDLALDTPPELSRPQAAASHGTPTEYREIDFVKTRALQDTKKARNMNL